MFIIITMGASKNPLLYSLHKLRRETQTSAVYKTFGVIPLCSQDWELVHLARTCSISITWELIRNAGAWSHSRPRVWFCTLVSTPDDQFDVNFETRWAKMLGECLGLAVFSSSEWCKHLSSEFSLDICGKSDWGWRLEEEVRRKRRGGRENVLPCPCSLGTSITRAVHFCSLLLPIKT